MQQLSFFSPPPRPRLPPLIGYNLFARHPTMGWLATYRESPSIEVAFEQCVDEFPLEEGWINLVIRNIETMSEKTIRSDEYIGKDGKIAIANNILTRDRIGELEFHIPDCNVCLQDCPECWEYYSNMGHDQFGIVLTSKM